MNQIILQKLVQQIHTPDFLLKICTAVYIQRKRYVFVAEYFRQGFDIKLRYLNTPDGKGVSYLVELHLFQLMLFDKTGKELSVCTGFCWFHLSGKKIMVRVVCIEFLDNIHQK